jgi:hypothetical protein
VFIDSKNLGDEAIDQMKRDLKIIHAEIGTPEFPAPSESESILHLPHTLGLLRDKPVFTSPDVIASSELVSQIQNAAGSFPINLDLDELVESMKEVDEQVQFWYTNVLVPICVRLASDRREPFLVFSFSKRREGAELEK